MNWTSNDIEQIKNKGLKVSSDPVIKKQDEKLLSKVKTKMKFTESHLQIRCVETFRLVYPKLKLRLFSIPNGSYRTAIGASILRAEGCTPGVPDIFLAVPKKQYGGMFIEFKSELGRLSEYQVQFIKEVKIDYHCVVIRSVEQFLKEVNDYLKK